MFCHFILDRVWFRFILKVFSNKPNSTLLKFSPQVSTSHGTTEYTTSDTTSSVEPEFEYEKSGSQGLLVYDRFQSQDLEDHRGVASYRSDHKMPSK